MQGLGIETLAGMPILDMLEIDPAAPAVRPRVQDIQEVVAGAYGVTVTEIRGACRQQKYAVPRQIAAHLCRDMTTNSYPAIGRLFGDRDHTTILFAHRKIAAQSKTDPKFNAKLTHLRKLILQRAASRPTYAVAA